MVPILSTLRLSLGAYQITLARLIVILTLLPVSFQSKLKDSQLMIYSNGPCLKVRFLESSPSLTTLNPLEVPLKIAGKSCSQYDPGWITAIDHYMDPVTLEFHLIWSDSDSNTLWTGCVNSTNYHINDVKQISDNYGNLIGSQVRSLIVDSGKLFLSLRSPTSRIKIYDLTDGLAVAAQLNHHSSNLKLKQTVSIVGSDKIGKVLYNHNINKLFWIEGNKCIWSGTPTSNGIDDKKVLLCIHPLTEEMIYSAVIDTDSNDIFIFYEKGKIERLSGPDWSRKSTLITNCLAEEKYKQAKFYSIEMVKENQFLRFYASDTQHFAFRLISLIKRSKTGLNDEGVDDEYILDPQNSGILFTDAPNVYDFIIPSDKGSKSKVINTSSFGIEHENLPNEMAVHLNEATTTEAVNAKNSDMEPIVIGHRLSEVLDKSNKYKSMMKPSLELIYKKDLPESSPKPIKELNSKDNLNTISSLSKIILSPPSSPPPIESLPPQITMLSVTSSSTIIYWLYAFLAMGIIFIGYWTLATLIGLKRKYQKVYSDDSSLCQENLTSVKY